MASTTLNLSGIVSPSDELVIVHSPERYTENIDDTVSVVDTFSEIHTNRYSKNLEDGIAVGDIIGVVSQGNPTFNLEDSVVLSDDSSEFHTLRTIVSPDDVVIVSDNVVIVVDNFPNLSFEEFVGVTDFVIVKGTDRTVKPISEIITPVDTFLQLFGIRVLDGTIDGLSFKSFLVNASGTLVAIPPLNWIFIRWQWTGLPKSGIQNLYAPTTTLIVPYGGGEIFGEFFNVGAIDPSIKSTIIILEPFDFEYIEDPDGDYILTNETILLAGDSVGVAKTNLTIEQGAAFSRIVIYRDSNGDPVNLTGYTAKMQIRKTKDSSTVILELSTSNGLLSLGGVNGTITMALATADTDALDFVWGRYDLELYPGGDTTQAIRLLEGKVNLSKQVTQ